MIKTKKAICFALAVVLFLGMFVFSGFAADQNAAFTVTASKTHVEVGETVTVTVAATTDYYAAATCIPVYYDADLFDLVPDSVVAAEIFGEGATHREIYDQASGKVVVAFVPNTNTENGQPVAQILNNATLFTFQLTAKAAGVSSVELRSEDQKTDANKGGHLYCGSYPSSSVESYAQETGQNFTLSNAEIVIGFPELAVIDGTTGVIDTENKYVYGVTPGDAATDYFMATNGGFIKMVTNEAGTDNGTGALLQLIAADGVTVLDTYTLIIFGDVNGDAEITAADYSMLKNVVLGANLEGAAAVAADVTGDIEITAADYSTVKNCVLGAEITVNPYA